MRNWSAITLLVLSPVLLHAQFTQAPSGYPQSQYPEGNDQGAEATPDPADAQHGVARISIAQGDVNVRRGDNGQLTGAVINAPLVARDHVQTAAGSRAEIQLDAGTILRLAPDTDLGFADLQYHRAAVQLGLGTVIFRVLQNAGTQVEIDTPSVGVRAITQGEYRISVFDNGTSEITVRSGQLELSGARGSERLDAGRSIMVRGDASNPEMQNLAEVTHDQLDDWSEGLDGSLAAPQSAQYMSADVQGAAELDRYGSWVPSSYGQSWHPQGVAADWSPYSDGQWSYVDYYGWSWIDASPWGWAPYHYGRWFNNPGYGWCWWPGGRGYGSYWSPALVGFFGFGGGLGWVALAPYEHFHPWWGRGGYGFGDRYGYRGREGIGEFRNSGFRGGVRSASFQSFAGSHQRFGAVDRNQIAGASVISGRLPVTANRAAFNYSERAPNTNNRFAAVQSRGFYHSNGITVNSSISGSRNTFSGSSTGGWQRFGSPGTTASRQNFQSSETSGWHNFGQPQGNLRNQPASRYSPPSYPQAKSYSSPSYPQTAPRSYSAPNYTQAAPRSYSAPSYQQQSPRSYRSPNDSAPRYSAPSVSAPRQNYSAPAQRQSQPHYSAPSAPRGNGGGGGGSSHSSGGGGRHGR